MQKNQERLKWWVFPVQSGWNLDWDIGAMEDKHPESKVKVKVRVTQLCLTLCDPMDYTVHGILQATILEWIAFPFSRGYSQPRDWTQVSHIAGEFFTVWVTREAQEYWSGSLSILQRVFQTQELNPGLPHWRQILYYLSHQGSPWFFAIQNELL